MGKIVEIIADVGKMYIADRSNAILLTAGMIMVTCLSLLFIWCMKGEIKIWHVLLSLLFFPYIVVSVLWFCLFCWCSFLALAPVCVPVLAQMLMRRRRMKKDAD